ncbi:MAG: sulfotransferase [Gammaproteobacteria bacterium]|nr:sulfotransferase [Gammaproteobacteria bacterium]
MSWIFVGGTQRGGTTLLQTLLCQDAEANPLIQEAKYLRHLVAAYRFGKSQFENETRDYFRDADGYLAFNKKVMRSFLENTLALFPGRKHLVLREPHLTMLFPELAELLPRARFLCLIRDPRDVIASMIEVGRKLKTQGMTGDSMARLFIGRDMEQLSRHVLSFYEPVFRARRTLRDRLGFLRYEDLVRQPEAQLQKLRNFTGLKLAGIDPRADPDTGSVNHGRGSAYQRAWKSGKNGRGIQDDSIGRFQTVLDNREVAAIETHCAQLMRRFKYQTANRNE